MRLGIDAREIQEGVFTGIGRPLVDLIRYFSEAHSDETCVLFSARKIPVDFGPNVRNVVIPQGQTQMWDQVHLPLALQSEAVDVFYSPYYKIPLIKPCPMVSAVLDLMYLTFEPYRRGMPMWKRAYYASVGRAYAHRADRIMTCSKHSQKEIMRIYGVTEDKIEVIPLSVGPLFRPEADDEKIRKMKARFGICGRYLLYVGNFKRHKNVRTLVECFAWLAPREPHLQLVLAGPREHTFVELSARIKELGLAERVVFAGKLTDKDEPHVLYSGAEVFVLPSLYEGFGLPPAEAMACGVPVVAANATSIPEVVRDAGLLVDPLDEEAMAVAISMILNDPEKRRELIQKGKANVQAYDPQTVSRRMIDLFRKAADTSGNARTTFIRRRSDVAIGRYSCRRPL